MIRWLGGATQVPGVPAGDVGDLPGLLVIPGKGDQQVDGLALIMPEDRQQGALVVPQDPVEYMQDQRTVEYDRAVAA